MSKWGRSLLVVAGITSSAAWAGGMIRMPTETAPQEPELLTCDLRCGESYDVTLFGFDGQPLASEAIRSCGDAEITDGVGAATLRGSAGANTPALYRQHGWFQSLPESCAMTPEGEVFAVFDPRPTGGLGVTLHDKSFLSDGIPIRRVYRDSAAEAAGLQAGDIILGVSDQVWKNGELRSETMLSTKYTDADNLSHYTTGPAGTEFTLRVQSPGESFREVTITRRVQDSPLNGR